MQLANAIGGFACACSKGWGLAPFGFKSAADPGELCCHKKIQALVDGLWVMGWPPSQIEGAR